MIKHIILYLILSLEALLGLKLTTSMRNSNTYYS